MTTQTFDYRQAVDRNLGWLKPAEQEKLHGACVAVAGVGGAGGHQAEALTRLGVANFRLADPDVFELTNFNRQVGSSVLTIGQPKTEVFEALIESINPQARITTFPGGITENNIDQFLDGADLVLDGVDFFAVDVKILLYRKAREKGIPLITACPIGFGASLIVFTPDGMDYRSYFDLRDTMDRRDKLRALAFGLSPAPLCLSYMDRDSLDFSGERASSLCPGLLLVGALAATEAVRILTGKTAVKPCPHVFQIDLLTQKVKTKHYPMGMRGPLMRLKRALLTHLVLDRRRPA